MNIEQRMLIAVKRRKSPVLLRKDVAQLGSSASVTRALSSLVSKGTLVKLGQGVYARATINRFSGKPSPEGWFYDLAFEALQRLGVDVKPSRAMQEYNDGLTTQIPAIIKARTPGRRITRSLRFGAKELMYE